MGRITAWIGRVALAIIDVVAPGMCAGCGSPARVLCDSCTAGMRGDRNVPRDAIARDAGAAGQAIRRAKAGSARAVARELAGIAIGRRDAGLLDLPAVDVVTWVPADRQRHLYRGGHLPEALARQLARQMDAQAVGLLARVEGRPQRGLGRAERLTNVEHAFRPLAVVELVATMRGATSGVASSVLLVDDVRATGATLRAAARALAAHHDVAATLVAGSVARLRPLPRECRPADMTEASAGARLERGFGQVGRFRAETGGHARR